jgi:hypothetical protein
MPSVDEMTQTMMQNWQTKTGKSLEKWVAIARSLGLSKNRDILNRLKDEYGLTYAYANLIAIKVREQKGGPKEAGDLAAAQYAGVKAGLLPVYAAV